MVETQMMLDRLVVIRIDGSLWGGRKKLRKEDLILADGSVLPPESLASLGSKRIADPKALLVFTRLKREAERICLQVGSRFLGGFAIPEKELPGIQMQLERIAQEFEKAKSSYLSKYDEMIEDWVARHPDFAAAVRRAVEPVEVVRKQLNFDYVIFRLKAPEGDRELLGHRVGSLSSQLFEEIALVARQFAQGSLIGKDRVTRKALSPLRKIRKKLDGLAFLDHRVTPVVETLSDLIQRAPRSGDISGTFLKEVLATTLLLSDPESIRKHGEGLLNPGDPLIPDDDDSLFSEPESDPHVDGNEKGDEQEIPEDSDSDPLFDPIPRRDIDAIVTREFWF
ncbi:MAG: DUF3150 domain-containing protein [Gammaproteobacteria bacterium]|nr:DUF3150 domain-containing protein [Gammaproteobacteria bacterium]NBT44084.1 DUF3150 domain-containing protein [Gammaproteobacteria bacterium]